MDGGIVTMDGSNITNCSGTARTRVHSSRVVGHWVGVWCGWVWWVVGASGWGEGKGERVCVCATWESMLWFHICVC